MCDAVIKNPPTNARDARDADSIPELIRIGNGNPLQDSCLGNLMDKESDMTEHACMHMCGGILNESIPVNIKAYHRHGKQSSFPSLSSSLVCTLSHAYI